LLGDLKRILVRRGIEEFKAKQQLDNERSGLQTRCRGSFWKEASSMKLQVAAPILLLAAVLAHGQDENKKQQAKEPAIREPALREELLAMEQEDVELRNSVIKDLGEKGIPFGGSKPITDPALVKAFMEPTRKLNELEQKHRTRLKEIVKRHGWPGASVAGKDGAHAAWLLVQHAERDLPFQKRCLKLMKAAAKGEVDSQDIAYLTDRVLVADKKKQLYGTQLQVKRGSFKPRPIEDEANVDKRRAEMGMSSLAEYLRIAQAEYDKSAGRAKEK
jgi:hypothetical protein